MADREEQQPQNAAEDAPQVEGGEIDVIGSDGRDEVIVENTIPASNHSDALFYGILAALEDEIMRPDFRDTLTDFCRLHCVEFDPKSTENKLIYTDLFSQYSELVESKVSRAIEAAFPGVTLEDFETMVASRPDELEGDVFDLLMSLGDFDEFRSLMCSYKEQLDYEAAQAAKKAAVASTTTSATEATVATATTSAAEADTDDALGFAGLSISGAGIRR